MQYDNKKGVDHGHKDISMDIGWYWDGTVLVNLYYIKNPKKATTPGDLGVQEQPWIKMYFLTCGVLAVVFAIIGIVTEWQFLYT